MNLKNKQIIKNIFNTLSVYIFSFSIYIKNTFAGTIEDSIIPSNSQNTVVNNYAGNEFMFSILEYIKNSIFGLLALISISVFIFIGAKLIIARGNPEEFKKALMHFIYSIVGLAIIAISWAVVKLVSSLNF